MTMTDAIGIDPWTGEKIDMEARARRARQAAASESGGLTTNSPPANVVSLEPHEPARWLASGIDTLVLTAQAHWTRQVSGKPFEFFELLRDLKDQAKEAHEPVTGMVQARDDEPWIFTVAPHGAGGYEWLLQSKDVDLRVQNSYEPGSRPSLVAELRSETLWAMGPEAAVAWLTRQLVAAGADVDGWKVSRVDVCCDVLLPAREFELSRLMDGTVTRARKLQPVFEGFELETYMIGRGQMCGRLYDKPKEIRDVSNKWWMWGRWGIEPEQLPADHRIIRAEFQVRRETLGELCIDSWGDLLDLLPNLWAYCSRRWLRLVDDRRKHHTHQTIRPWWAIVQSGVEQAQDAAPLVRAQAVKATKDQILRQLFGQWISYLALDSDETPDVADPIPIADTLHKLADEAEAIGLDGDELRQRVNGRMARYKRQAEKYEAAAEYRKGAGLPAARNVRRQMRKFARLCRRTGQPEGQADQQQRGQGER